MATKFYQKKENPQAIFKTWPLYMPDIIQITCSLFPPISSPVEERKYKKHWGHKM